jgi:thymidylate synthase (FAD)
MQTKTLVNVLDHGYVRLVSSMGDDLSIVRAARVSYDADWRTGEDAGKDEKLLAYLLRNRHTSPFESVVFTFEIKAPIFVVRQWHRHRTWAYNEVSARYTELPEEFYVPEVSQITTQSNSNKQMRSFQVIDEPEAAINMMRALNERAFDIYKSFIAAGMARELARTVLPLATYTRFFGTVNLHNLLHFLSLRLHEHAQYEIRVYAEAIRELIRTVVPITIQHWEEIQAQSGKQDKKTEKSSNSERTTIQATTECAHVWSTSYDGAKKCQQCGTFIPPAFT